jgi:hypothetical protein
MNSRLNTAQMKRLKSRFRAAGCAVKDINDSTFEVVDDDFPVRTHVEANPYYVQLGTYVLAKPARAVAKTKVRKLLCDINLKAKLVKFTMEADRPDKETTAWPILASVKLVTGVAGGDYQLSSVSHQKLVPALAPGYSRGDGERAYQLRDSSHDGHREAERCLTCALHWTPGRRPVWTSHVTCPAPVRAIVDATCYA